MIKKYIVAHIMRGHLLLSGVWALIMFSRIPEGREGGIWNWKDCSIRNVPQIEFSIYDAGMLCLTTVNYERILGKRQDWNCHLCGLRSST